MKTTNHPTPLHSLAQVSLVLFRRAAQEGRLVVAASTRYRADIAGLSVHEANRARGMWRAVFFAGDE